MAVRGIFRFRVCRRTLTLIFCPGLDMDLENRLRKLESLYRTTLSAAVAAKARYLALQGEPGATAAAVERAKAAWQALESRKTLLARQMVELEKFEHDAVT
jgi:hypothetical protein